MDVNFPGRMFGWPSFFPRHVVILNERNLFNSWYHCLSDSPKTAGRSFVVIIS